MDCDREAERPKREPRILLSEPSSVYPSQREKASEFLKFTTSLQMATILPKIHGVYCYEGCSRKNASTDLRRNPNETPSQSLEHLYDHIAKAIRLFLFFEVPYDATPGPYGGGIIRHPLFKNYEASIEYSSVAQLHHHINKVRPIPFRV